MKKLTALLLALIMAFSAFAMLCYADGQPVTAYVAQYDETEGDVDRVVNWYEVNGKYYIFIPASIDCDTAKFYVSGSNVTVNGAAYTEAKSLTEAFGEKTEAAVVSDGVTYNVVILKESKVASVFIATESGSLDAIHADKSHKEKGFIEIVNADGEIEYDGVLDQIKGRGNSTWEMEKKPYNIKLDEKANLFGMGKSKKWSLIANHGDASLIRNALAYEAAKRAGMEYTPLFVPVDVYINGNYEGAYLLTTRIEVDKTRINIQNLEDANEEANPEVKDIEALPRGGAYGKYAGLLENTMKWVEIPNDPEDITGGYVIEMELANRYAGEVSGFVTSRSQPFTMKSPEYASKAQMEYISSYYQKVEDAIYASVDMSELNGILDVESMAQMYLINEWCSNMDASLTSTYFYKPVGEPLHAGPVWDFDIAFGNNDLDRFGNDYTDPYKWTVCYNRMYRNTVFGKWDVEEKSTIYNVICKNGDFIAKADRVWFDYMEKAVKETITYIGGDYVNALEGSAVANAIRWNIFGTTDVETIEDKFEAETASVLQFARTKASTISSGIGQVQNNAPETNFIVKAFKGILVGVNNLFEKAIVLFGLENME